MYSVGNAAAQGRNAQQPPAGALSSAFVLMSFTDAASQHG